MFQANDQNLVVTIIRQISITISTAVSLLNNGQVKSSRDAVMRASGLMDLISSSLSADLEPFARYLEYCSIALETVLEDLTTQQDCISVKSEQSAMIPYVNPRIRNVYFHSIIGSAEAKQSLFENVVLPLTITTDIKRKLFSGIRAGSGNCLLFGPPGTGKTCLAQAAACEAGATFFAIRPSDMLSKYQGESERYLSGVFEKARAAVKAVIFFDEFDSLAAARGGADDCGQHRRLLAELLLQLTQNKQCTHSCLEPQQNPAVTTSDNDENENDNDHGNMGHMRVGESSRDRLSMQPSSLAGHFEHNHSHQSNYSLSRKHSGSGIGSGSVSMLKSPNQSATATGSTPITVAGPNVVVIAATNRLEDLDQAVLRRFDAKIYVGVPDLAARTDMVLHFLTGVAHSLSPVQASQVARDMTEGWSGAEIENLCREAAMTPLRSLLPYLSPSRDPQSYTGTGTGIGGHRTGIAQSYSDVSVSWGDVREVCLQDFVDAYARTMAVHETHNGTDGTEISLV